MMRRRTIVARAASGLTRREALASAKSTDPRPERTASRAVDPSDWILAVPDIEGGSVSRIDIQLLGAAQLVARSRDARLLVLSFDERAPIDWSAWGVDGVVRAHRMVSGAYEPERDAARVAAVLDHWRPRHCFFPETSTGMGEVGRRVTALKGLDCVAGVSEVGHDWVRAFARGGSREFRGDLPTVVFLDAGTSYAPVRHAQSAIAELAPPPIEENVGLHLNVRGVSRTSVATLPLAEAQFILAAGNGVSDWTTFLALADALNATVAGSRVVCDRGTLPKSRQVGTSGAMVSADCYIAVGISGAPEHLAGITTCSNVIAVNHDPNAPMLRRADLAVVADANAVLQSMLRLAQCGHVAGVA